MRRSSSGGGGCGDDRPSRAGGAGLVLSWAGRWSVGVAARSSSGELVVVPSWWWCVSGVFVRLGVLSDTAGILLSLRAGWETLSELNWGLDCPLSVSSPHIYVS